MSRNGAIRHALIMAAGRGNRMRPFTDVIPKAMLPYRDGTLIGHSLLMLGEQAAQVHITVGYKSAMLAQYVMNFGVSSVFNTEGHSNSWWIHNTLLRHLDEPVLVLTCDNITELDFEFFDSAYEEANHPACMLIPVTPIPKIDGDYIDHNDGYVCRVQRQEPSDIYCSGIQILNPARVVALTNAGGDFYSIWNQLIAQHELRVSSLYPRKWFTVDTLEQLTQVTTID